MTLSFAQTGPSALLEEERARPAQREITGDELAYLRETQTLITAQPGPQTTFLECPASIAIYGGAAGGGKSYAALLEPLYHIDNPKFEAVLFRRTFKQISAPGGLWDRSMEIYPQVGGKPSYNNMLWTFPSGARVRFSHMQHEQDVIAWKGSEITLIELDELTDFTEYQFFYMLSRNRSLCGIVPYMRGFTNPDSESWVKHLIGPWVDPEWPETAEKQGWPKPVAAASGEIRWFVRESGVLRWCDKDTQFAKSITFIAANVFDNKILLEKDPNYLANLNALPELERQRLLLGSWTHRPSGNKFKREWFPLLSEVPTDLVQIVRFWDLAATEYEEDETPGGGKRRLKDGPDYTAGVLVGRTARNTYIVLHAVWVRRSPLGVRDLIRSTAETDGFEVEVWMEEEGGSGGPNTIDTYRREVLPEFNFHALRQSKNKLIRGNITASIAEMRHIELVRGYWNEGFLNFLMAFPNPRVHDDVPDAFFSAIGVLSTSAGSIPMSVSGGGPAPLEVGAYVPADGEMDETESILLARRQGTLARLLQTVRTIQAYGEG